jgi:uncharacterized protein
MKRSWLLVALLALGCPSPNGESASAPTTPKVTPTETAAPPPATEPAPQTESTGPAGPPGPARPPIPGIDDGRDQLDLLEKRRIVVGRAPITAYIADTDPSRRLGLMWVRSLPTNHGMLFVFPEERNRGFWMKNCYIPLSVAYIAADGRIDSIVDMEPHVESSHPSRGPARFALEMPKGWFRERNIGVGTRVEGIVDLPGDW